MVNLHYQFIGYDNKDDKKDKQIKLMEKELLEKDVNMLKMEKQIENM